MAMISWSSTLCAPRVTILRYGASTRQARLTPFLFRIGFSNEKAGQPCGRPAGSSVGGAATAAVRSSSGGELLRRMKGRGTETLVPQSADQIARLAQLVLLDFPAGAFALRGLDLDSQVELLDTFPRRRPSGLALDEALQEPIVRALQKSRAALEHVEPGIGNRASHGDLHDWHDASMRWQRGRRVPSAGWRPAGVGK